MIGAAGSSLTSQMYQKMFAQVDRNGDGAVSLDELVAMKTKASESEEEKAKANDLLQSLDRNADGKLQANEFVADKLFDRDTLGALLTAQEYRDADPDARAAADRAAVDALFTRADLNGDGVLDKGEMEAEKALRRAETLDTGILPEVMFLAPVTEDGKLSRDDLIVGRMLPMDSLKVAELPPEMSAQFERIKELAAERAANEGDKPGRSLEDLRAQVQAELDAKPLSTELMSRLLSRLRASVLEGASPADRSV